MRFLKALMLASWPIDPIGRMPAARQAASPCMANTYMLSADGMAPSSVAMSSPPTDMPAMRGDAAPRVDVEFPNLRPEVIEGYRSAPEGVVAEIVGGAAAV